MPFADIAALISSMRHHHEDLAKARKIYDAAQWASPNRRMAGEDIDYHLGLRESAIRALNANMHTGILPLYKGQTDEQIDAFLGQEVAS